MSAGAGTAAAARPRFTGRGAVLLAVVLILAATLVVPLRQYLGQRARMGELERKIAVLSQERGRLEGRIRDLQDPKELERIARECLGMVKPGEIAFVAVPKKGTVPEPDC